MLMSLVLAAFGLVPHARAAFEFNDQDFFRQAKPMIDDFVARQEQFYGVELALNDATWASKTPIYGGHTSNLGIFNGGRWDQSCRDLSAELNWPGHPRAHFFVRVTYPQNKIIANPRGENPHFELVPTCNRLKVAAVKPELTIDGVVKDRLFSDEEFIKHTTPLIQALLRTNQKKEMLDAQTFELRRKGVDMDDNRGPFGWLYLKVSQRNVACRRVRVYVPEEKAVLTTYVSVIYNRDDLAAHIPQDQQSILKDTQTFRPYRFSLVNGCDRDGFFEPAKLRLRPVVVKTQPVPTT